MDVVRDDFDVIIRSFPEGWKGFDSQGGGNFGNSREFQPIYGQTPWKAETLDLAAHHKSSRA